MSKRNSIINKELRTSLRRSSRLVHNQQNLPELHNPITPNSKPTTDCSPSSNSQPKPLKDCPKIRTSLELCRSDSGLRRSPRLNNGIDVSDSLKPCRSNSGLRRSPRLNNGIDVSHSLKPCRSNSGLRIISRLNNGVDVSHSLRRSSRFFNKLNAEELVKKKTSKDNKVTKSIDCGSIKRKGKCEVGVGTCEQKEVIGFGIVLGLKAVKENQGKMNVGDVVKGSEEINGKRKLTCGEEGKGTGKTQGWVKEQEIAFQSSKYEVGVGTCEQTEVIGFGRALDLKALKDNKGETEVEDVMKGSEAINGKRKRKRGEEGKETSKTQGWTKEQEVALQRSYFAAKPTPHFWKKVSKLVPGKSAQECFDKVHSDHVTPLQPQRRSRANKKNSSPLHRFSLSASKLLKPIEPKSKRPSCNNRKSHLAQKMVRHLLQKNCHTDPGYEADLFSVLEPTVNPSIQVYEHNDLVSTPKHIHEKQEFFQKCHLRSSGRKKPLSKFRDSWGTPVVTPPVLKQVKDRALHEKYIDQLHRREAKRKAASAQAERFMPGKENIGLINSQKIDVIRAAKNALVTDARNVINQLQHLNENTMSNSSDFDCDGIDCADDDEDETER